ncbi:Ctr copper transporter family-domain-containing protein [Mycotypha africana]|uniref:Ctr copper transporter family-domain-containing protein n=1 Tax=Mycotypha africana TaxID=64632 RepID=UPI0023001CAD|nr:Ctr copper transporter family-domain-containing protein [Mycotypha africana]KAI8975555.1 Ctr copper transporter family-domain-containing protein [Mycotypha africana]
MEGHDMSMMHDHAMHNHAMPGHDMPGHDMPMGPQCSMNMLFNWQVEDTCVVFRWWHISGPWTMFWSCLIIFLIGAAYEWMRAYSVSLDNKWKEEAAYLAQKNCCQNNGEEDDEVTAGREQRSLVHAYEEHKRLSNKKEIIRSTIYASLVGVSFWLMLVFMTYNGYLMLATVLGAGFGHFVFGNGKLSASRSIQCH